MKDLKMEKIQSSIAGTLGQFVLVLKLLNKSVITPLMNSLHPITNCFCFLHVNETGPVDLHWCYVTYTMDLQLL